MLGVLYNEQYIGKSDLNAVMDCSKRTVNFLPENFPIIGTFTPNL